jgi:predicted dehydrogenase
MQVVTDRAYLGLDFSTPAAHVIRPSADLLRGQLDVHRLSAPEKQRVREALFTDYLPLEEITPDKRNAILDQQREFVACIREGRKPRVSGQQARDCLAVAEQIADSIAAKIRRAVRRGAQGPMLAPQTAPPAWIEQLERRKAG